MLFAVVHALTAQWSTRARLLCLEIYEKKCSWKSLILQPLERILQELATGQIWASHGKYLRRNFEETKHILYRHPCKLVICRWTSTHCALESETLSSLPWNVWKEMFLKITNSTTVRKSTSRAIDWPSFSFSCAIYREETLGKTTRFISPPLSAYYLLLYLHSLRTRVRDLVPFALKYMKRNVPENNQLYNR